MKKKGDGKAKDKHHFNLDLPHDLHEKLEDAASKRGVPVAALVRMWLYERMGAEERGENA